MLHVSPILTNAPRLHHTNRTCTTHESSDVSDLRSAYGNVGRSGCCYWSCSVAYEGAGSLPVSHVVLAGFPCRYVEYLTCLRGSVKCCHPPPLRDRQYRLDSSLTRYACTRVHGYSRASPGPPHTSILPGFPQVLLARTGYAVNDYSSVGARVVHE